MNLMESAVQNKPIAGVFLRPVVGFLLLLSTLLTGPFLLGAALGWAGLAIYSKNKPQELACAAFFFAPFFHAPGFFPHLAFTLKHFHIMVFLMAARTVLQGSFVQVAGRGIRKSAWLWPVILLLAFSVGTGALQHMPASGYRMSANLALVLGCMIFLLGYVMHYRLCFLSCAFYFVLGCSVLAAVNFYNLKMKTSLLSLDLLYNNQHATLMAIALFHAFAVLLAYRSLKIRQLAWALIILLGVSLLYTMSRTAWLSFAGMFVLFLFLLGAMPYGKRARWVGIGRLWTAFGFLCAACAAVLIANFFWPVDNTRSDYLEIKVHGGDDIVRRMGYLFQFMDPSYWAYTLQDTQNFGFFGILRLKQLHVLADLMKEHFWFGIGLVKEMTDFHGFYFTLLGAAGFTGLCLFALFAGVLLWRLKLRIQNARRPRQYIAGAAVFCAVLVWLVSSITQSMFIHFSVWLQVLMAFVILESPERAQDPGGGAHDK